MLAACDSFELREFEKFDAANMFETNSKASLETFHY